METTEETQAVQVTDPLPPDIRVLVALRKAGYHTIKALAKDTKISRPTLSRILRGYRYEEAIANLESISKSLGLTLDELVQLIKEARVNPLYLHPTDELDYVLASVDGESVLLPTDKSA